MSELRVLIGERLRAIRKANGLTQQNVADASDLDDAYIGAMERGERNFSIDILEKVLTALNIRLVDILQPDNDNRYDESVRQKAIDEYIAITSKLTDGQIDILRKVNKELSKAFK